MHDISHCSVDGVAVITELYTKPAPRIGLVPTVPIKPLVRLTLKNLGTSDSRCDAHIRRESGALCHANVTRQIYVRDVRRCAHYSGLARSIFVKEMISEVMTSFADSVADCARTCRARSAQLLDPTVFRKYLQ
jgi:hypothetical protein